MRNVYRLLAIAGCLLVVLLLFALRLESPLAPGDYSIRKGRFYLFKIGMTKSEALAAANTMRNLACINTHSPNETLWSIADPARRPGIPFVASLRQSNHWGLSTLQRTAPSEIRNVRRIVLFFDEGKLVEILLQISYLKEIPDPYQAPDGKKYR